MNILVTGGAGYIGSVTVEQLIAAGHQVVVYDSLYKGYAEAVHPDATFVQADLADKAAVAKALSDNGVEAVMHFAADSLVGESVQRPAKYFRNNVINTLNLLEAMQEAGVRRFVLSSTAAVYGEPESTPIREDARLRPTNPYGESKLAIERFLPWYGGAYGLRWASLRYFNAAGASDNYGELHDPETHLIPIVLQAALGKRPYIEVFGDDYPTADGTCIRDYVHVIDLAVAHILALAALEQRESVIYNLGNGQGFSNKQVIEVARKVTGKQIPMKVGPRRPGDPAVLVASSERIRTELGWQPRYPDLAQIIETAWRFMQIKD
jgi:UDP-glucose 4-epimerase